MVPSIPRSSQIPYRNNLWAKLVSIALTLLKVLRSWTTYIEYQLRVSRFFTFRTHGQRVFFPGCSLTAADPALVMRTYDWLRARDAHVALWSDCCGMPLDKFSSANAAARGRKRTLQQLRKLKTTELITACGNCAVQFAKLAAPGVHITSLYELLAEEDWGTTSRPQPVMVHHPCSARIDKGQQRHFRAIAERLHLNIVNIDDAKHPLPCCLIRSPRAMTQRKALVENKAFDGERPRLLTYCAHCTMSFQSDIPTRHVLQEVFGSSEENWVPKGKVSRFRQYWRFARMALGLRTSTQFQVSAQDTAPTVANTDCS